MKLIKSSKYVVKAMLNSCFVLRKLVLSNMDGFNILLPFVLMEHSVKLCSSQSIKGSLHDLQAIALPVTTRLLYHIGSEDIG